MTPESIIAAYRDWRASTKYHEHDSLGSWRIYQHVAPAEAREFVESVGIEEFYRKHIGDVW